MTNTLNEHRPERALWAAVITQAIHDLFSGRRMFAELAYHFIFKQSYFAQVCDLAGLNYLWVRRKVLESMSDPVKASRVKDIGKRFEKRK